MFGKDKVEKLNKLLRKKFDILYDFKFDGLLLFYGDSLRRVMMDLPVSEYTFILHNMDKDNVLDFFQKFKLNYDKVSDNEYKFMYKKNSVKLFVLNDLIKCSSLSIDFLFYDVQRQYFIPFGIKHIVKTRRIYDLKYIRPAKIDDGLDVIEKKNVAKQFVQYLRGDKKRVRIITSGKLKYLICRLLKFLKIKR